MTDLHTHILPGMDDGAKTVEQSLQMLQMQLEQCVDTVVLTPHFYRERETVEEFLSRRGKAMAQLTAALPANAPQLLLGAEVAWFPGITGEDLEQLCIEGSRNVLLELPYSSWSESLLEELMDFTRLTGLDPILAHVDRYLSLQKDGQIEALINMGFAMQLNAETVLKPFGCQKARKLLRRGAWYLGSDCHRTDRRVPCLNDAVQKLRKYYPAAFLRDLTCWQPE